MFSVYKKDIYGLYDNPYGKLVYMTNDMNAVIRYLKNLGMNYGYGDKDKFRFMKRYTKCSDGSITIDDIYYDVRLT